MKKIFVPIICFFVLILFSFVIAIIVFLSIGYPVGNVEITDESKYLDTNDFTQEMIDEYSVGVLPAKINPGKNICNYNYSYNCALFGEPTCVVYLSCKYADIDEFKNEENRINTLCNIQSQMNDYKALYTSDSELINNYNKYTDNEVLDGLLYIFEFAIINQDESTIEYVFAIQYDHTAKDEIILGLLTEK